MPTVSWNRQEIGSLCEITSSKRIYASDYRDEGVPFYRGKEIIERYNGNLQVSTEIFISERKYEEIKKKHGVPQCGDLLLTSVGTLGVPFLVKPGETFYFKDGNLTWFRRFKNINSRFLYYWLLSPMGTAGLKKCTIGTSQSAFTIVLLKKMELSVPPLPTQHKIAAILSAYDELIENNNRRIKILEEMTQSIYQEWFVNFRFPGHENVKMVDSPLGMIPEGWSLKRMGDIATIHRGRSYTTPNLAEDEGLPFINLKCIERNGGFRRDGLKRYVGNYKASQVAKQGDIVVAVTDMTQERRIVAHAAMIPTLGKNHGVFSMDLVRVEPNELIPKSYIYSYLRFSSFSEAVKQYANGVNVLHLSPDHIRDHVILLPSQNLISHYGHLTTYCFELIDILENRNGNLRQTRDLLLPRLISGEIDVTDLDIQVPEELF